ncbi:MAG: hypothetical protein LH630_03230 [Actinomycetia bacterium]|nr:hypothetical protein [Actinomycetes bacterium]
MNAKTAGNKSMRTVVLVMAWFLLGGCSPGSTEDGATTPSTDGPLKVMSFAGELSADAPRSGGRWMETFSAVVLCTTEPIDVTSVVYSGPTSPISSFATLHWISEAKKRTPSTVISMRGAPDAEDPEWSELGGRFVRVSGDEIRMQPNCEDGRKVELLTTLDVSKRGADIDAVTVEYSSQDIEYQLEVPYHYVACGQNIADQARFCE